ncbi:MAG: hypothetical protein MZV64_32290 [Ignavibacteriales bacterium]|nr:hypothetical protein [Ignavibacteriales bacterium]
MVQHGHRAVTAISGNDKNWIAADQTAGPYANYVYTTMTNGSSGNFARSTDFGATWQNTFSSYSSKFTRNDGCRWAKHYWW